MRIRHASPLFFLALSVFAGITSVERAAAADDMIIKQPGAHVRYGIEAEPHLLLGFGRRGDGGNAVGLGVRGTIVLVENGFVPSINNNVGLGVGIDFLSFRGGSAVIIPVVMQWNFFLSKNWSVFGEPGLAIVNGGGTTVFDPVMFGGGRFHFSERLTLTMRLGLHVGRDRGYEDLSVGLSFLL